MSKFLLIIPITFFLYAGSVWTEEITVDLRNPTYTQGILSTEDGGVIQNKDIRIQAKRIEYTQKKEGDREIHQIRAEEDLMIQYKGKVYVGKSLTYDFLTKTGTIMEGKTSAAMWFVGGDQIELKPDGSYRVKNVSITTCENKDSSWDLHAKRVNVLKEDLFEAKKIRFRMCKLPLFWLPSFKVNLKKFREPIFRYTVNWDKGQGPRAAIRYQLYSWQDFAFYGRLEYRWKTGWGGAIETEFFPKYHKTTFVTRSYLGKNRLETAPDAMRRYRLQGALHSVSQDDRTSVDLLWDKYNDVRMPTVFKADDFEVGTAKRTLLYARHQEDLFITSLKVRPKANPFESIKQDLPTVYFHLHPLQIGQSGFYNSLFFKAAYLDFSYSTQLLESLHDFRSARVELRESIHRPVFLGPLTLTPFGGVQAVFYSNSPSHHHKNVAMLNYGANLSGQGQRQFSHYKHVIEPYARFHSITHPNVFSRDHYIFSIADGYQRISQIKIGVRNLLFSSKRTNKPASFTADLYANAFFSDATIPQLIPRLYCMLLWQLPSLQCTIYNAWNFRHHLLDFSKLRLLWTVNENIAFSFEARYRSKYDWRKADHNNFILDVSRSETELLLSPLSDRRITILSHLFVRLNPLWEFDLSTISGFYRMTETPYTEVKADLSTWVSSAIKVRLSYNHVRNDDRFSFHLDLVKK